MPQKATPSTTLAAAVRTYLGLSQEQLAAYLGVSRGQVAHLEAGRRQLAAEPGQLLRKLAAQLPPPLGSATKTALNPTGISASSRSGAKVLRRRLATCHWQLANLRVELAREDARVELAHRWQQLRADGPEQLPADNVAALRRHQLLRHWTATTAQALGAGAVAARYLLALRIRFTAAEVAALEEILAS
ncbi:helix-turn-helix transcriptional regulator [Hymenobacter lapidiphilus]|uniref:Helix-turn-helix transcriptional regulator n=1 Tax=Hymenobacter lapidiphilus TaxID=2608003 RepID=A0A7Y7PS17_9BACT|nr:helix-turn-helix transcriptional regulator [Hymenobacter lapidiphilus]NVO32642.1 helix-turn-helix transcriptional regulator [Hymenobacter lapidiphilus]